jgi:hypothetical protein
VNQALTRNRRGFFLFWIALSRVHRGFCGSALVRWGVFGDGVAGLLCLRLGKINLSPIPTDTMPNVQCGGLAKPQALRALLLRDDTPGAPAGRVAGLGRLRWATDDPRGTQVWRR